MPNLSEKETREQIIDHQLKRAEWNFVYIKKEVNSIKSNFRYKEYILSQGPKDNSGRFIDYLLQEVKERKVRDCKIP